MLSMIASVLDVSESFLKSGAEPNDGNVPKMQPGKRFRSVLDGAVQEIAAVTGMTPSRIRITVEFIGD